MISGAVVSRNTSFAATPPSGSVAAANVWQGSSARICRVYSPSPPPAGNVTALADRQRSRRPDLPPDFVKR